MDAQLLVDGKRRTSVRVFDDGEVVYSKQKFNGLQK